MTTATLPDHIIDQARATDLTELATRYGVTLRKESASSWCGPCPKCGGDDRWWVKGNRYTCRGCGANGDTIAFVQDREGCGFQEAVSMLTGYAVEGRTVERKPITKIQNLPPAQPKPQRQPPDTAKFTKLANDANHALFTDPYAEIGRQYLLDRGIEAHCWQQFSLGYRPDVPLPGTWDAEKREYTHKRQPAIVMPWYRGGKVVAIRYRFLTLHEYTDTHGKPAKAKQTAQPGSLFTDGIYGAHALPEWSFEPTQPNGKRGENYCTLVICEGELNAISIWQTCNHWNWEVLSLGSESAHVPQVVINEYARHFQRVLVWMDRPERAREEMASIGPLAYAVNSIPELDKDGKPVIGADGKPRQLDANDLMRAGLLGGFLASVRLQACRSAEERQSVIYALQWASEYPPFLDDGGRRVVREARGK